MQLASWEPHSERRLVRNEMDRLAENIYTKKILHGTPNEECSSFVDISETDISVVVQAELQGWKAKDLHLRIKGDTLTIIGVKEREDQERNVQYQRVERYNEIFQRVLHLPCGVEADKAKANFSNGVLKINLPRAKEASCVRIVVA
jgi:HSP20 family protein